MMVVERVLPNAAPKSPIGVRLSYDLVNMKAIEYDLHNFHPHQSTKALCMEVELN